MATEHSYQALPINELYEKPSRSCCCTRKVCGKKVTVWQILLALCLLTSGLLLILYFFVAPVYIQRIVNRTEMTFEYVILRNLTQTTFVVSAKAVISSAGPVSATLVPSANLSLSYLGYNLGYVNLPTLQAKRGQSTIMEIVDQQVLVSNVSLLVDFSTDLINNNATEWEIDGHIDIVVWHIPFPKVKFSKTVSITGMNGLKQITVNNYTIPGDQSGQLDLVINGSIYNPSFVDLEVGDIHFAIIFNNSTIGEVVANNVTLVSGENMLMMTGAIRPTNDTELEAVNVFVNQYISCGNSTVSVRATSSPTAPDWLNTVLQTLEMTTSLAGACNLTLIYNISISDIFMALPGIAGEPTDSGWVNMSSLVSSGFQSPFPISLEFMNLTIYSNLSYNGEVFGAFPTTSFSITTQTTNSISFQMQNNSFYVVNRPVFMALIEQLLLFPEATFTLSGVASASAQTEVGLLNLDNVYVTQSLTLNGIDGFQNKAISVQEPNDHITNGYVWGFQLFLNTIIYNPSSASLWFPRLSFDIFFQGVKIGNATATNLMLNQGSNYVVVYGNYTRPKNLEIEREFMSSYLQGNDTSINLVGNSFNIPLVLPAMEKLNISVTFPGNKLDLLRWVKPDSFYPVTGALALYNPINCIAYITSLSNFTIYKLDWTFFTTAVDTIFEPPFGIEPSQTAITGPIGLDFTLKDYWESIRHYLIDNHTLLATGIVGFQIEEFGPVSVDALQNFTLVGLHI